jgi:hypothetical protein
VGRPDESVTPTDTEPTPTEGKKDMAVTEGPQWDELRKLGDSRLADEEGARGELAFSLEEGEREVWLDKIGPLLRYEGLAAPWRMVLHPTAKPFAEQVVLVRRRAVEALTRPSRSTEMLEILQHSYARDGWVAFLRDTAGAGDGEPVRLSDLTS